MRLLEVVIPNITFKFGANNFNFIRVRLGQVRLGQVRLCYVNFNVICATNEHHICNQHIKKPHYQQNLCMREVAYLSLIFTGNLTLPNPNPNKIKVVCTKF